MQMADDLMLADSGLSKLEREMIAVAVSSVNHCHYCLTAHGAAVRQRAKDPEMGELIAQNYRAADLPQRQKAMLDFAVLLTEAPDKIEEADREELAPCRFQRPRYLGYRRRRRFLQHVEPPRCRHRHAAQPGVPLPGPRAIGRGRPAATGGASHPRVDRADRTGQHRAPASTLARNRETAAGLERSHLESATFARHITGTRAAHAKGRTDGSLRGMRNTVAVMNTKGGVGKSTLVLTVAETLSAVFRKNVLIIDSDSQASVSAMLLSAANLHRLQSDGLTIVDLLVASVLNNVAVDWPRFVVGGVSDVDEARTVYLIPSDMQLTLFEREVSKESLHARLRTSIGALLNHVRGVFDIVLIDCPPGLSVLTESWLREADFHFSPTKPDYVSTCGLEVFPALQGPQSGDGVCRKPRRRHQR